MLPGLLPCVAIGDMDLTSYLCPVQYGFRGLGHVGAWWHGGDNRDFTVEPGSNIGFSIYYVLVSQDSVT